MLIIAVDLNAVGASAACAEESEHASESVHHAAHDYHPNFLGMFVGITSESLLRLGGEYAYEVGEWEISPQLDWDFVDGEQVWVLGVVFGKGFIRVACA